MLPQLCSSREPLFRVGFCIECPGWAGFFKIGTKTNIFFFGSMFRMISIVDDDEAWFVVERLGILSQCFMAAEPRHPFIYISILVLLERLLEVPNIQKQYVPSVTGPGALKVSTMSFLKIKEEKIKEGKYVGVGNKTLTVVGKKGHANDYILRESASGIQKKGGYFAMGMVHFASKDKTAPTESCYEFLHKITSI